MIRYAKPTTVDEALALLGGGTWRILAGGTDFYPVQGSKPFRDNVLDINGLTTLRGIVETASHWIVGARTTWTDVIRHPLPPAFDALKQTAREVGSAQIQNVASVAGNLCNASPAADGVPGLLVLDAEVELRSVAATRHLPLSQFILGNRRTALQPGEMVTAIRVPKLSGTSAFVKLGARRYLVISIAMVAARLVVENGTVADAAVAVGSCSA
ncbi:FAD binding domain-containing protein, partial [Mesorhizobium sp. M8A.F.Ca.ET.021.01.1.1]